VGERIVRVALAGRPRPTPPRPRVAVVGAGIFGVTCALELSPIADVTLFERHDDILTEASFTNQRRHHSGFHYPRSYDSIVEIRAARQAFEAEYEDAIDRRVPAYYCTSASGVEIPAERYLAACRSNHLSFSIVEPPAGLVDGAAVSLCLLTDEAIYDMDRLKRLVTGRLTGNAGVRCLLRTAVDGGVIAADGSKHLTVSGPDGTREESFDYLVNATYANRNLVARWFGFPVEPLRFDLLEILELRLPIAQACVTIMDGPFTSLTGMGRDGLFFLSHIHDSVSRSVIPDEGMPPAWSPAVSNRANMLRHAARYLPVLSEASDLRSWWMTRAVNAFARDFDARPTVITDHGFGCWSLLGGKIVTSVANAREIARAIGEERQGVVDHAPGGGPVRSHRR
jgi:glycine/D-amino acid oxidase-like deaminating enzyme